jgi:imidazolonepropionase
MTSLCITNASEIVTGTQIISPGEVCIEEDIITRVGKPGGEKADVTIDATGKTILPGFIDCHTHLVFGGSREFELDMKLKGATYQEIARVGGITYTMEETRRASKKTLYHQAEKRLNTMLAYGTTTVEAKSGYGLNLPTEIKILEVTQELNTVHPLTIIPTFMGAHAIPPEYTPDDYVAHIIETMIPAVSKKNLARFCDVFCEKGYFSIEQSRRILMAAKTRGMSPKIHADEFTCMGGAELAAELNATSADHLLMAADTGLAQMAHKNIPAVLLPATPFSLPGEHYAPAQKMMALGVPIALATDLNPNCWTESMQFIIQLACYRMGLTPLQAIQAATHHAAQALGIEDTVGRIEPGKKADLVLLNCPSHQFLPYHFGINLVEQTIKQGKIYTSHQENPLEH